MNRMKLREMRLAVLHDEDLNYSEVLALIEDVEDAMKIGKVELTRNLSEHMFPDHDEAVAKATRELTVDVEKHEETISHLEERVCELEKENFSLERKLAHVREVAA